MYDHTQKPSYLIFATANKTNKKSHFNTTNKKIAKSVCSTSQRIKTTLCARKKNSYFTGTLKNSFLIFRDRQHN